MKVLVVHAHPEPQSFCAAMKDAAVEVLKDAGHEVEVSDLYAMNFKAVADATDFGVRRDPNYLVYALEQRTNHEEGTLAPDIREQVGKVIWADLLILSFPIFWFSTPGILKGWIDRVMLSGPMYGGRRFYDRGGLRGRKALVAATLGGRRHMFGRDAVHGELEDMLRHLLRGTLYYVGYEVLEPYFAFHVPYLPDAERAKILDDFRGQMAAVDSRPSLSFPSLDGFDDEMRPKKKEAT